MSTNSSTRMTLDELRAKRARGEKSATDWARVDALTDEDIERAMRDDPDWSEWIDVDWSKAEVVVPVAKKSISIRLDEDVIDFFKATGKGYQTRMNAILRHYVREQRSNKS
ncbi:BrnA antitoxin family protein [Agrobacterium vaccinii]|nr:BrnA antitoxin family protein [Agrobacterium vaccinii]